MSSIKDRKVLSNYQNVSTVITIEMIIKIYPIAKNRDFFLGTAII